MDSEDEPRTELSLVALTDEMLETRDQSQQSHLHVEPTRAPQVSFNFGNMTEFCKWYLNRHSDMKNFPLIVVLSAALYSRTVPVTLYRKTWDTITAFKLICPEKQQSCRYTVQLLFIRACLPTNRDRNRITVLSSGESQP